MADYNNIVTAPVSVRKVARLLGTSKLSVSDLCTCPNINMWSKYKPVQSPKVSLWSRDAEGKLVPDTTEWMRVRYGLDNKITIKSITEVFNKDNVWGYNRPNGGTDELFRLGDFNSYYHNAVQPFGFGWPTEMKCESETTDYFVVSCFYDQACMAFGWRADGCLNFRDCFVEDSRITDRYFTVVMRAWNSKTQTYRDSWFMMSAEKSIGEDLAYSNPVSLVRIPYQRLKLNFQDGDMIEVACCVREASTYYGGQGIWFNDRTGNVYPLNGGDNKNFANYTFEIITSLATYNITMSVSYTISSTTDNGMERWKIEITSVSASSTKSGSGSDVSWNFTPMLANNAIGDAQSLNGNGGSIKWGGGGSVPLYGDRSILLPKGTASGVGVTLNHNGAPFSSLGVGIEVTTSTVTGNYTRTQTATVKQ